MDPEKSAPQIETPAPITANTPLPKPKCPSCPADPIALFARTFKVGRYTFILAYCTKCRNVVPAILFEIAEPMIQTAGEIPGGLQI